LDVFHPGRPNVSRGDLAESLAESYKVPNPKNIVLFGFKTQFGGGKSTGFALIYDTFEDRKLVEPRYRFVRDGLEPKIEKSRKQLKELKNRKKKVRGKKKAEVGAAGKKK
jgi:small subunit ribosomal protein S24e